MTESVLNVPPFPTCIITTADGSVTVPCEPIGEHLAITPTFGMTEDLRAVLGGDFVITHRRSGKVISDGPACIECCRSAGKALLATSIDWAAITEENAAAFLKALPEDAVRALAEARTVNWTCDAEDCEPWPDGATGERAESRASHLGRIVERNARILAEERAR